MPIEFRCSQCSQLLRVPDDSAGKNARCPKCQALMIVPGGTADAPLPMAQIAQPAEGATADHRPVHSSVFLPPEKNAFSYPSAGSETEASGPPPDFGATDNPFSESAKGNPFGAANPSASLNPYASPASIAMLMPAAAVPSLPINPQPVPADVVFNYAWEIWKTNLGLLVGVTLTIVGANYAIAIAAGGLQVVLQQQGEADMARIVEVLGQIVSVGVQFYLGIGKAQINLKLARRQAASYGDLFGGLHVVLPLFLAGIIAAFGLIVGFLMLIIPFILMLLAFWPFYYLIIDEKTGILESFSVAYRITQGNWASTFVLWLMSIGISLLGCLALCAGALLSIPLISMMFAVAYLMMSGQLRPYDYYPQFQAHYPAPATQ